MQETFKGKKTFYAKSRKEWRKWLEKNSETEKSVWLIFYNKLSKIKSVPYEEAVEEGLCFGWIDSVKYKRDDESSYQYFSPRKLKSNWSKSNRDRVKKLTEAGLMTESGQKLIDHAKKSAIEVGYPIILKTTAGGGGKGMRVVWKEEDIEKAYESAKIEAAASFKNDGIYMEKYVEEPRHIEIQVAGDQYGNVCHLSERDCSIQRRHQKLVEESPSPFMTDELRHKMGEAAIKAAASISYEGVGTIEFLVDKHRNFYFMEMNTRIQVEHCVTEEVINFDLIKEQIKIAAGEKVSGNNYLPQMHAIECRINAEDPYNDFRPSPGKITVLNTPGGHGVRVDSHVYAGYTIPPYYDSMIGKLIAVARTREEALDTMQRALSEYVIEGIKTTIPFHLQLMENEDFRNGNFTTKFMESFKMQ